MDGTLLDTTGAVPAAFVRSVHALGGPDLDTSDVVDAYWRGTPEVILEHLVGRPLTPTEIDVYYRELEGVDVAPYPEVADTFAALKAWGRARAVFTGASYARGRDAVEGIEPEDVAWGHQYDQTVPADVMLTSAARALELLSEGP